MTRMLNQIGLIEVSVEPGASMTAKGNLLERLVAELVSSQNFKVTQQVRLTGTELDLLCVHRVNGRRLYVECKAHRDPLSAGVIKELVGTLVLKEIDEGWLVSTGPLGKEAKGLYYEWANQASSHERQRFSVYPPDLLIETLLTTKTILPPPVRDPGPTMKRCGAWVFVVAGIGYFWISRHRMASGSEVVLVYDATTCAPVTDLATLTRLANSDASFTPEDIDGMMGLSDALRNSAKSTSHSPLRDVYSRNDTHGVEAALLAWLERDQSQTGMFIGQFGLTADPREGELYEVKNSYEKLHLVPRLHLTGMPTFVMTRHGIGSRCLDLVRQGVRMLLQDGFVRTPESLLVDNEEGGPGLSYRHTIRAIQIAIALSPSEEPYLAGPIDVILSGNWQNSDGGWRSDDRSTDSSLYTSLYAAALLNSLTSGPLYPLSASDTQKARSTLETTVEYLASHWETSRWACDLASAEQNTPQAFAEVADVIREYSEPTFKSLRNWLENWLDPDTSLIDPAYFRRCYLITEAQAYARFSYCLLLAGAPQHRWQPLFEHAVNSFEDDVKASDVAYMIAVARQMRASQSQDRN